MVHRTFLKPHKKAPLADRILTTKVAAHTLTRNGAMEKSKKPSLADRKQTAEAAVLSFTRNGAVKDRESPGKRKGELQWLGIDRIVQVVIKSLP
jgi:hypothetical protein